MRWEKNRGGDLGLGHRPTNPPVVVLAGKPQDPARDRDRDRDRDLVGGELSHERVEPFPGEKAPNQASQRWHVERTHAWQNTFYRLARWYERRVAVIDAFFDLADTITTVRSLFRGAWTTHRWDNRPNRRP